MVLITPGLGLVVWMTLVFLVLLLVLGKFGWPVVSKMIDERETLIQNSLDEAQKAREEMENLKFNNDILLKKAMEERDEILKEVIQGLKSKNPIKFRDLDKENIKTETYTKFIYEELLELQPVAMRNATRLFESHGENHNPEKDNPSTTIHKLVEILNNLKDKES